MINRALLAANLAVLLAAMHPGKPPSLTVSELNERSFTVSLIPETLERTTLGVAGPGTKVNLEVDVLAKYVERLVRS